MGAVIGLMLGLGLLSLLSAVVSPAGPAAGPATERLGWPGGDTLLSILVGAVGAGVPVGWLTTDPGEALLFGALGGGVALVARQEAERRRGTALLRAWPVVVDGLLGALQAGLDHREAWSAVVPHSPLALRSEIAVLAREIDAAADPAAPIRSLQGRLADPTTQRVTRALLLGSESGQSGRLLRLLADELRRDAAAVSHRSAVRLRSRMVIGLAAVSPWVVGFVLTGAGVARTGSTVLAALAATTAAVVIADRILSRRLGGRAW